MLRRGETLIILDGGYGSEFERRGLQGDPMTLNLTHPREVQAVHRDYAAAGADIITVNSFGLNRIKYHGDAPLHEAIDAAIDNARAAGKPVYFDIGPTGDMLAPVGTLSFDEAYDAFAEVAKLTRDRVDGYIAETFSDLYEMKACVLALKENAPDLPIFATMTFDRSSRTLTGSTPEIVAAVLEGLGVDALGVNCSLGPRELLPVVKRLLAATDLPIAVQPNCGLPQFVNGVTEYTLTVEEFARYAERFARLGVAAIGGCCGTTPDYIRRIAPLGGKAVPARKVKRRTTVTSARVAVDFSGVRICGERLNPTGKPKLKEAYATGDYELVADEATAQAAAGADLLDLNCGVPKIDEAKVLSDCVRKVQEVTDLPLCLDSSDAAAIERACRYYAGIPLINSVNGDEESMRAIFPIAKKYGAVVLGLAMDGAGVPPSAQGRAAIARRIIERASAYGIARHKIMIDTLVVTASAQQKAVRATLRALSAVSRMGVATALGVSNVSFGLPCRPLLNRTFLAAALERGLKMPILNPLDAAMTGTVRAYAVLSGEDEGCGAYVDAYHDAAAESVPAPVRTAKAEETSDGTLYECIYRGRKASAESMTRAALQTVPPLAVVSEILVPALTAVGDAFESGKLFLPQLVSAAETAKIAFGVLSGVLPQAQASRGKIVLATVRGDVHDIGKNIVRVVAQSHGYTVIDLGKDVPASVVVETALRTKPLAVGLSALMTTTVASMEETVRALKAAGVSCPVFVGGAVLTPSLAAQIGADRYTKDALEFVRVLETEYGEQRD